ncbi:conserved hypothetical protein [Vibrio nigripulchritudo SFn27]|uniref:Solute-binding protein family 3/N-terminal domain-containing protein n=1 Tax=Vibrio nigripulchritudo TaxID=28173 RepID=U4K4W7_9VIBR|nr:hypothetical protein [Vibrio nigripulchritudo]CCN85307.1 conserved hypothetical protein [Vibrio nigripulchritudo BLFn1]CCN87543.1 conserved hypothetical protein [Vibrio nigripulchritudo SFn27]CCN92424.1 conserved hypothetical protein [Vibrio nigripulchritudo ENn2]CCO39288.1 conserved hypothetical protein [Vibrio nigripulchritudo SFn135]CCO53484.1 conserved hypothetical protein [Vibrio nigripulchritudo Wn13]
MRLCHWLVGFSLCYGIAFNVFAINKVTLTLPAFKDNGHEFFHELLTESLKAQGIEVTIITPSRHTPQKRAVHMLNKNQISLYWLVKTNERDKKYALVDVPLTNGMIGQRILLIPEGAQHHYKNINTLLDLQKSGLVAGLGANWYDIDVWKASNLPYHVKDGEWRQLYEMLSETGGVNYFPRGMHEVLAEAEGQPQLEIEDRLILKYNRSMVFYLSESAIEYKLLIERALKQAKESGLMHQLIDKHWKKTINTIKPEDRTIIELISP